MNDLNRGGRRYDVRGVVLAIRARLEGVTLADDAQLQRVAEFGIERRARELGRDLSHQEAVSAARGEVEAAIWSLSGALVGPAG